MEKAILFNTEMVRAILSGRKTTTRRIVKGNIKDLNLIGSCSSDGVNFNYVSFGYGNIKDINSVDIKEMVKAPYLPGDILYVRETWLAHSRGLNTLAVKYKADDAINELVSFTKERFKKFYKFADQEKWQPSLFMPKEAARIYLKVTDVRIERLQDITEEQAKSEGAYMPCYKVGTGELTSDSVTLFSIIWDNTLKKEQLEMYKWNVNPWVWVIDFEIVQNV